jgi:hypothetical protein
VTQNQIVLNYGVTNTVSENTNYKNLIEDTTVATGIKPENVTSDSGYGNEENYVYLEEENLQAFVKNNTYDKEKSPAWLKKIFYRFCLPYPGLSGSAGGLRNLSLQNSLHGWQSQKLEYQSKSLRQKPENFSLRNSGKKFMFKDPSSPRQFLATSLIIAESVDFF